MAFKPFKLVDLNKSLNESKKRVKGIDWAKCALCQEEKDDDLKVPFKNNRKEKDDGYVSLARNLEEFNKVGQLPASVDITALKEGMRLEESLFKNRAVWHSKCYLNYSNSRLERAKKRSLKENMSPVPAGSTVTPVTRRSFGESSLEPECLFCKGKESRSQPFSTPKSQDAWESVIQGAAKLGDSRILTALDGGRGLKNVRYHKRCYTAFSNSLRTKEGNAPDECQASGVVLARLYAHMLEVQADSERPPVFKMADLARIYAAEMRNLNIKVDSHSTRLRERLLDECPDLESLGTSGQDVLIGFRKDIDRGIRADCKRHFDSEAFFLSKAANVIRTDLFQNSANSDPSKTVPLALKTLIQMILNGPGLTPTDLEEENIGAVTTSISQLIAFHVRKRVRGTGKTHRHDRKRETEVPVYVATKIYGETRKKELVDTFYGLGLSISYDRLQAILDEKAQRVSDFYMHEGVVCPKELRRNLFTTAAADNIDHNPSSTTAKGAFHGTAISLMQHSSPHSIGVDRQVNVVHVAGSKKFELPSSYALVKTSFLDQKSGKCPATPPVPVGESSASMYDEKQWLNLCLSDSTTKTWAEHCSENDSGDKCVTKVCVLPLFTEQAGTMGMMLHCMKASAAAINHINPTQVPVMVVDNGLYGLCKSIQWQEKTLSEDKFFVMLGGMHIELWAMRLVGQWLEGSGWVGALIESGVTTSGRAEATVKVSHLTRSRYALEVTAAVLFNLQHKAYDLFLTESDDPMTFRQWLKERRSSSPQFKYWDISLNFILIILQLVRATRLGDFDHYLTALAKLVPWFFALDHVNYARWLPVHIRDLQNLQVSHPALYEAFKAGFFVGQKTGRKGSRLALDQMHEQENARLKGDGGMIGLTENATSLRKWMLATPELAKMNENFETFFTLSSRDDLEENHHSATKCCRDAFNSDKNALEGTMEEFGNPFLDCGQELYDIDSKKVCSQEVVETVNVIEDLGKSQYNTFVKERLESSTVSLYNPIKLNKLPLFSKHSKKGEITKTMTKLKTAKKNCDVFSRLYRVSAKRPTDQDVFFKHENQEFPPAIAQDDGSMRATAKSEFCKLLVDKTIGQESRMAPQVDAKILDGAVIVHMLKPRTTTLTFKDYVEDVYLPFVRSEAKDVKSLHLVWDRYLENSLKSMARDKRGDGCRTKVDLNTKIRKKVSWMNFLRNADNKIELFHLLASAIKTVQFDGTVVCSTLEDGVVISPTRLDLEMLSPCNHEEADTRMFVHAADALSQGHTRIMIRTSDTDVLVIAVSCVQKMQSLKELWIHLNVAKENKFIPVHEIAAIMALLGLYAGSGCDNVPSLFGYGKSKWFHTFEKTESSIDAFIALAHGNMEEAKEELFRFVVAMYSPSKCYSSVNECRKVLFVKYSRALESIPPTEDALEQNLKRASYQAQVWHQSLDPIQKLPSPADWGWKMTSDSWVPVWRTIPLASDRLMLFVRCKCKAACKGNCSCKKYNISCCDICLCPCNNES